MTCVCIKLKETNSEVSHTQHVAVLYYDKHYLLEQDTHLQKCNIIANISVGLDVNILHCVEWLGLTDSLVLPCVLNVTPYLKSAIVSIERNV